MLNGIFYILRTGAPWRDLPDDPLVMLHLQRTLGGARYTVLYAATK